MLTISPDFTLGDLQEGELWFAVLATLGARWYFARQWSVDISVVEDIRVETAPNVTFQASLRYRPGF